MTRDMVLNQRPQTKAEIVREIELLREQKKRGKEPYRCYLPYKPQADFHKLGSRYNERGFFAGNQLGKTLSAAHEAFYHASGLYPDWWDGEKFSKPTVGWIGGDTGETIRDTSQRLLFDRPGKMDDNPDNYAGIVPLRLIVGKPKAASGVQGLFDHVKVKHVSGGTSYIFFKSYSKGRQKWQGDTIDWLWLDEEPPPDIYSEGLTRTNKGQKGQFVFMTFTPLLGMSEVVTKFLKDPSAQQVVVRMTIYDVEHYTDAEKEAIIASYPEHEREARAHGTPIMGSGRVFAEIDKRDILEHRIQEIPHFWKHIIGIDFGWDHPSAAVHMLHDADNDVIHVRNAHRIRRATPLVFAQGIIAWPKVPVAWPHDGLQHDKGSGEQLAKQYRDAGLNMLPEKATFSDGTNGLEAGVSEMLIRMQTGRFKVDSSLVDWIDEFMMYHRKDGVIVKLVDDLLSATRYGMMMLRFAKTLEEIRPKTISNFKKRLLRKSKGGGGLSPMAS